MIIDLSQQELYDCDKLDLATKVNYIYGKNGTGKSTLAKLIIQQFSDTYDVRVFQGFEAIVGDSHKLDAVVLGEINTKIQTQIDSKLDAINSRKSAIEHMKSKLNGQDFDDKDNLAIQFESAQKSYAKADKAVTKVYSDAAKNIKTRTNPQISATSYNKGNFIADIPNAKLLADAEREALCETLKSEVKNAVSIKFPVFNIDQKLDEVNSTLAKKVEPKKIVVRLDKDAEKQHFAKMGMQIHKKGDVCAFCGNPISDEVFEELGSFFSADETMSLQREIDALLSNLDEIKRQIRAINMDSDLFYPEYLSELNDLKDKWHKSVIDYSDIIDVMCAALEEKQRYLFEAKPSIAKDIFKKEIFKMDDFQLAYADLCQKNNASDLGKAQKEAKEKLRLDAVYTELEAAKYSNLCADKKIAEDKVTQIQNQIDDKWKEINTIEEEIERINGEIKNLQAQTINEQKLADNINKTLSLFVGFELEHYEDYDNKGYYRIKDKRTGETRPVDKISTGEKNVIAFLYFMEKLHEVKDPSDHRKKLIVFDDPLNSNDEMMQFLIADRFKSWIYEIRNNADTAVILTHNISFYLDICRFNTDKDYQQNSVYHLEKTSTYKTKIKHITQKNEDIGSAYEEYWKQLKTLYNSNESSPDSLLNLMRKIVETYCSFIKINKYKFCGEVRGAMELLNANSHGVKDLSSSTNGLDKDTILKIFYQCFAAEESGKRHIKRYWENIENLIK